MRPLPSGRRASKFDRDFTSVDKLDSFSFKYIKISFATFYFSVFQCREIFYLYQIFSQKTTKLLKIQHIRYVRNYRRTGNPRQTRSHPWVKSASSNFARWSESPFEVWLRAQSASYQEKGDARYGKFKQKESL